MPKTFEWFMAPFERAALVDWLMRYNGYAIVLDSALKQLEPFGIVWDAGRGRLTFAGTRSVALTVHPKSYFQMELMKANGHGVLEPGDWRAVWALDIAVALLSLAGIEHDPTHGLPTRSLRFKTIVEILRPEAEARSATDLAGEVRE